MGVGQRGHEPAHALAREAGEASADENMTRKASRSTIWVSNIGTPSASESSLVRQSLPKGKEKTLRFRIWKRKRSPSESESPGCQSVCGPTPGTRFHCRESTSAFSRRLTYAVTTSCLARRRMVAL